MYIYHRFITLSDGKTLDVIIESNDTVENLKQVIQSKLNIPIKQQNIIYQGKSLLNDQCLCDYDIQDDTKLCLVRSKPDPLADLLSQNGLYN